MFVQFFRISGRFRQSVIAAFAAVYVYSSSLPSAHARGQAHGALTQQNQQHRNPSKDSQNKGFFSTATNNGNPDKPDGSSPGGEGLPQCPQVESVEKIEERAENIEMLIRQLEVDSDTETETECEEIQEDIQEGIQIDESYKSNSDLKKVSETACNCKRAMKNLEEVKTNLRERVPPMQIGNDPTDLGNGYYYIRKPSARMVIKINPVTGDSDVVAFSIRSNPKHMKKLANVINSQHNTKQKINPNTY